MTDSPASASAPTPDPDGRDGKEEPAPADSYAVEAFNTATESQNRIHSDDVAATYGFRGALVPGVDVYAYLTHLPVARWGTAWLGSGTMAARFRTPVYDGDRVTVTSTMAEPGPEMVLELRDSGGQVCATAVAGAPDPDACRRALEAWTEPEAVDLPADAPAASPASLARGTVLGAYAGGFHAEHAPAYLADVRESSPLYTAAGVAHPGWLLRFANWVLSFNVRLGPWIHVGSVVHHLDTVGDGQRVEARAVVTDEHERAGHRFVVLDVALTADGRPVQRIDHTVIYQPRRGPKPG